MFKKVLFLFVVGLVLNCISTNSAFSQFTCETTAMAPQCNGTCPPERPACGPARGDNPNNLCSCYAIIGPPLIDFPPLNGPICGNGIIEVGEQCDPPGDEPACGPNTGSGVCKPDCTCEETQLTGPVCGNSVIEAGEQCDPPGDEPACGGNSGSGVCTFDCQCQATPFSTPVPTPTATPINRCRNVNGTCQGTVPSNAQSGCIRINIPVYADRNAAPATGTRNHRIAVRCGWTTTTPYASINTIPSQITTPVTIQGQHGSWTVGGNFNSTPANNVTNTILPGIRPDIVIALAESNNLPNTGHIPCGTYANAYNWPDPNCGTYGVYDCGLNVNSLVCGSFPPGSITAVNNICTTVYYYPDPNDSTVRSNCGWTGRFPGE